MELPASLSIEEILRAPSAPLDDPGSLAILANSVASLKTGAEGDAVSPEAREQVLDHIRNAASKLIMENEQSPTYGLGSMLQGSSK